MARFNGVVEDIVFRNDDNGWTVAAVKVEGSGRISAVGILPFLAAGDLVTLEGELVEHPEYGRQIKASSYQVREPESVASIEKYLGGGLIRGVGPATAKLIVRHFGDRTLDVLDTDPQRLTEVSGIGKKRAAMIIESYTEKRAMRSTMLLLQSWGLTPALAMKVYRTYGDMTEAVLKANPYRMVSDVDGVGFKTADAIAMSMGFAPESEFRLKSGVVFTLNEAVNRDGHTFLPKAMLIQRAAPMLNAPADAVEHVIEALAMTKGLMLDRVGDVDVAYLPRLFEAEQGVAAMLMALKRSIAPLRTPESALREKLLQYQRANDIELCTEQEHAVLSAVTEGLCVITGGPGTGKTTSIKCIIHLMQALGKVELCAPTGRAAKRMSEATGRPARTIHRMLEYSGEGGFQRNADNPLEADVVIVDEMSMVDLFIMQSLLKALKPGTRLVMVGDADQLPSVGAGNVLGDMIASHAVPVARLTEIFRQAQKSMIIVNAHRIDRGEAPVLNAKDADFFIDRKETVDGVRTAVVGLVQTRLPRFLHVDGVRDIQVMTPMKKGDVGVYALNEALQAALNPPEQGKAQLKKGDTTFRTGDKVMQIKNDYELGWTMDDRDGTGVFNGDIGYVRKVDREEAILEIEFDDGRVAQYEADQLDELELAYCMSVHKSQGSEFEAVVLPLLGGPNMLLTRNLLYTAVTRAKRLVVIVGRESVVKRMVDNDWIQQRYSALAARLAAAAGGV